MAMLICVVVVAVLATDLLITLSCVIVGSHSDSKMRNMSILNHHQDGQQFKEE